MKCDCHSLTDLHLTFNSPSELKHTTNLGHVCLSDHIGFSQISSQTLQVSLNDHLISSILHVTVWCLRSSFICVFWNISTKTEKTIINYLSWGRAGRSQSSSCCTSYTSCHSDSSVVPARPARSTGSCRSQRSGHTEAQSELRTRGKQVFGQVVVVFESYFAFWKLGCYIVWCSLNT